MARIGPLALHFCPLALTVLAFAFSLKATTSRDWALRHFYDPGLDITNYTHPIYTQYRSPFIVCDAPSEDDPLNTLNLKCLSYPPFGFNQTSCELASATKNDTLGQVGDARLCQQIHYTGNLAIASTLFIGLGFLLTLTMTVVSILVILFYSSGSPHSNTTAHAELVGTSNNGDAADPAVDPATDAAPHKERHHRQHFRWVSPAVPYVNLSLILFLTIGAMLYILAQFYAVLALTMSAPDNGAFAAAEGNLVDQRFADHEPWIQGKSLTVYASLAWFFSGLGAAMAGLVWRWPRWEKAV